MRILLLAACLPLAACAANPKETSLRLSEADPKYASDECRFIRDKVLDYDDRVGSRAALGLVSGLLLGPLALPIAVASDAHQNNERDLLNRELARRCVTLQAGTPEIPAVATVD